MTKSEAKHLFYGAKRLAEAIGVTRQAIHNWPEQLEQKQIDLITGAALRLDIKLPEALK